MFTLAHISDPHLSAVPKLGFVDLASKRLFGFYNWRRNRAHTFAPAVLAGLVADIHAAAPDHVAITGDLVNLGLESEFIAAAEWLRSVAPPADATLIPGNHDAYMPASTAAFSEIWGDYMRGDGHAIGPVVFPFVRRRGPVALVGVSSAVATPPLMATGTIGERQIGELAHILEGLGREGLFRVVLVHHSPMAVSWYRRLTDAGRFLAAIAKTGAELILHGHEHRTTVEHVPVPGGRAPVVGVAAASVRPREGRPGGSYCLYRIETGRSPGCIMVERGVRHPDGPVETLGERRII